METGMNAAKISKSKRLQRLMSYLADCRWHTTLEIVNGARICAVNSAVSELRANHFNIECERDGDVWKYRMVPKQDELFA